MRFHLLALRLAAAWLRLVTLVPLLAACGYADAARPNPLPVEPVERPLDARLTVLRSGMGTVESSEREIRCGDDCTELVPTDTAVTLTAVPAPGWLFTAWQGVDCPGIAPCVVTVDRTLYVTARFDEVAGLATAYVPLTR